jgi:methyl-accepting chemotaxis protein
MKVGVILKSLQTRILLFFSVLLLIACTTIGLSIFMSSQGLVESSIGTQAMAVAERAVQLIDLEAYTSLKTESGENAYYKKLRGELNDLRQTNGLKYLYTLGMRTEEGDNTYYYMVDGAPEGADEGDFSPLGEPEMNEYPGMIEAFATGEPQIGDLSLDEYGATLTAYVPILSKDGNLLGILGADYDASAIYALMEKNRTIVLWVSVGIFLISMILVYILAKYLANPLIQLTSQMAKVRSGDMTVEISINRKDEIGRLAQSFQQLVMDTRTVIQGIRKSAIQLQASSAAFSTHSQTTVDASLAITTSIIEASQGASTQVKRASETTKAVEEITVAMHRIAESSSVVAEVSHSTTERAKQGSLSILSAKEQMDAIHTKSVHMAEATEHLQSRSGEIGEIIILMKEIATQTNLLALNAAIEAARAGDHGRGFAVVADEVRKLANQSQNSSIRISELIEDILLQTETLSTQMSENTAGVQVGLNVVKEADAAFRIIANGLELMNIQVQEVSAASQQVAAGSEEVTASVDEMEEITKRGAQHFQSISSRSDMQLTSMKEVSESAQSLHIMSEELKILIDRFKV